MKRDQLPALTGLRFFAASMVVYAHFGQYALPSRFVPAGAMGVSFFYLLSGFILAYTYLTPTGGMRGTMRAFYVARFARIYPAYLVGLVLYLLAIGWWGAYAAPQYAIIGARHPLGTLLTSLTLTQAWVPWWGDVINPPATTLAVEALFYALFPLLAPALARIPTRRLIVALGILYLVQIAPGLAVGDASDPAVRWLIWFNPAGRLPEFCMGTCLGVLFLRHRLRAPRWAGAGWATSTGLALGGAALWVAADLPWPIFIRGVLDPAFLVLLYGAAWGRGRIASWLSRPGMVLLGEASYALYILHYPVWEWLTHLTTPLLSGPGGVAYFLAYALLTVALSIAVLRFVETPARRWIRRRWAGQEYETTTVATDVVTTTMPEVVGTGAMSAAPLAEGTLL